MGNPVSREDERLSPLDIGVIIHVYEGDLAGEFVPYRVAIGCSWRPGNALLPPFYECRGFISYHFIDSRIEEVFHELKVGDEEKGDADGYSKGKVDEEGDSSMSLP